MAKSAIIKVALANTANGSRIAITLQNGDVQWYPLSYVEKLLAANFMEGARPTVLIGTECEYTKITYKKGDHVVDQNGAEVKPVIKHTKDGVKLVKFTFGEIVGNLSEFDKAQMNAKEMAKAVAAVKSAFILPARTALVEAEEVLEDEPATK